MDGMRELRTDCIIVLEEAAATIRRSTTRLMQSKRALDKAKGDFSRDERHLKVSQLLLQRVSVKLIHYQHTPGNDAGPAQG